MKILLFCVILVIINCDYFGNRLEEAKMTVLFEDFITTYGKVYGTENEKNEKFAIFKENMKIASQLNEKDTAEYGVTKFSDMSAAEFKKLYLSSLIVPDEVGKYRSAKAHIPKADSWDWRQHGGVTSVKNQGSCGSCWAFSATANIEGQWALGGHGLMDLSEQQVVDCDHTSHGCNGGWPSWAFAYVQGQGGIEGYNDYQYTARQGSCQYNQQYKKASIGGHSMVYGSQAADYLYQHGPLSTCLNANNLQYYKGGIITGSCSTSLNHAVLFVGYGVEAGVQYWTVKNSWSSSWGEGGYFKIERGKNTCGIEDKVSTSHL